MQQLQPDMTTKTASSPPHSGKHGPSSSATQCVVCLNSLITENHGHMPPSSKGVVIVVPALAEGQDSNLSSVANLH